MKNLPSFNEFKKFEDFLETSDAELIREFEELEKSEPFHTLNEGGFLDHIKNKLSKFFLGSLSRVGMLDQARKALVDLEIDAIEKKSEFEESMEKLDSQIDALSKIEDKDRIEALRKDRESKIKEQEAYIKSQRLKIKKAHDFVEKVIDGNTRRREYYEAGRADDEIGLAELNYLLAKKKFDTSEIAKYEEAIKKAKANAEAKAEKLENRSEENSKDDAEKISVDTKLDPEKEKRKLTTRRGKDIISRKNELEKDIVDLKSALERKLKGLELKSKKGKEFTTKEITKIRIELLEISSALDAKINLLKALRDLGKTEEEISKKIKKESEITKLSAQVNKSIVDGQDANTGTKKLVADIFSTISKDGRGKISSEKIKNAINKINK
jgi:hypothetical protein